MSGPPLFLPGGSGGAPWHQPGHSCGELHGHRGGIWLWKIHRGSILMGRNRGYRGTVTVGDQELSHIREDHLLEHVTYVGHQSYLFQGTVRANLRMGCPTADETQVWAVLERVKLADFSAGRRGWTRPSWSGRPTCLGGSANGWRWRGRCSITVRCIFSTKPPPTSTWRVRMPSCGDTGFGSDQNGAPDLPPSGQRDLGRPHLCMEQGNVVEQGTHEKLCQAGGRYQQLWQAQMVLEHYGEAVAP